MCCGSCSASPKQGSFPASSISSHGGFRRGPGPVGSACSISAHRWPSSSAARSRVCRSNSTASGGWRGGSGPSSWEGTGRRRGGAGGSGWVGGGVGVWVFGYGAREPKHAQWLTPEERETLERAIDAEEEQKTSHGPATVLKALTNGRVLFLSLIYFLIQVSVSGVVFYLPTQVAALMGQSVGLLVGSVTAIP